jgi:hypothetical protein
MAGVIAAVLVLSSYAAGHTPISVEVRAGFELQCGWPGPRIDVVFPAEERLPAKVERTAVRVDGKPPAAVSRSGRTISLTIARPAGVMCNAIGPARVHILFTRDAHIGNPAHAGTYRLAVRHAPETVSGAFSIH